MTCRELTEFILDYLDGTLPAETRNRFERHLAECPECVDYLRSYRATLELERSAFAEPAAPPPADLIAAILESRKNTPQPPASPS